MSQFQIFDTYIHIYINIYLCIYIYVYLHMFIYTETGPKAWYWFPFANMTNKQPYFDVQIVLWVFFHSFPVANNPFSSSFKVCRVCSGTKFRQDDVQHVLGFTASKSELGSLWNGWIGIGHLCLTRVAPYFLLFFFQLLFKFNFNNLETKRWKP